MEILAISLYLPLQSKPKVKKIHIKEKVILILLNWYSRQDEGSSASGFKREESDGSVIGPETDGNFKTKKLSTV